MLTTLTRTIVLIHIPASPRTEEALAKDELAERLEDGNTCSNDHYAALDSRKGN